MRRRAWAGGRAACVLWACLALAWPAAAATAQVAGQPLSTHVEITPAAVKLGEIVRYRGIVTGGGRPSRLRVVAPVSDANLGWGVLLGRHRVATGERTPPDARGWYESSGAGDSLVVEVPLQVFRTGIVPIPGLRVEVVDPSGTRELNLPMVTLVVVPLIAASDSTADLHPLRGPMPAPWWERVPWRWVAIGALVLAALALLVRWLMTRRRKPVIAPAQPLPPLRDPLAEALAELAALRAEDLPAAGRSGEHAFRLTRILRRFLERSEGTPRPGDTSPELVGRLEHGRLQRPELERLAGLLSRWDRVKFARAAATPEEAAQAEQAVEAMMRRLAPRPAGKAA